MCSSMLLPLAGRSPLGAAAPPAMLHAAAGDRSGDGGGGSSEFHGSRRATCGSRIGARRRGGTAVRRR